MPDLSSKAEAILAYLRDRNRPVVKFLRDGIPASSIHSRLAAGGFVSPVVLSQLWGWRNGTEVKQGIPLDDVHFFPGFYFMSCEASIDHFMAIRVSQSWSSTWLPIFTNGAGDYYAIELGQKLEGVHPIVGFIRGEIEHPVEYQSLDAMFSTLLDCYEQGAFWVTDEGYLEMDDQKHAEIARRNNPEVGLWKSTT